MTGGRGFFDRPVSGSERPEFFNIHEFMLGYLLPEKLPRGDQRMQRLVLLDGAVAIVLAEFSTARVHHQGQMGITRRCVPEKMLKVYLTRC